MFNDEAWFYLNENNLTEYENLESWKHTWIYWRTIEASKNGVWTAITQSRITRPLFFQGAL